MGIHRSFQVDEDAFDQHLEGRYNLGSQLMTGSEPSTPIAKPTSDVGNPLPQRHPLNGKAIALVTLLVSSLAFAYVFQKNLVDKRLLGLFALTLYGGATCGYVLGRAPKQK